MTEVSVAGSLASVLPADCIVVGVGTRRARLVLTPDAPGVTAAFDGDLLEVLARLRFTGAEGEAVKLPAPPGISAGLVLAVGLGEEPDAGTYDLETVRRAAGTAVRYLRGAKKVVVALPVASPRAAEAVAMGALLGAYAFTAFRTDDHDNATVGELAIIADRSSVGDAGEVVRRAAIIAAEVNRCRDLVNTPANVLYPDSFAAAVGATGTQYGLGVEVLDEHALADDGYGGILGVGQGSVHAPRLVKITHTDPEATAHIAYVGKGITYDSGGISLKPVGANEIMKRDMSGAAAVFAAVLAVRRLEMAVNVTGWLALAENMPSGSALRPGDVLHIYGGRTVEVLNTDAEGRLVLADALVRAAEEEPDVIVDVATLTAAMRFGLGNYTFGVMAPDDVLRNRIVQAAERTGEQAWPMPLPADLRNSLRSQVADIANTGERMGGGLVAGLFLRQFVPEGTRWAHLDIAGPAFHEGEAYGYTPSGGTGCAVRTLVELAQDSATDGW